MTYSRFHAAVTPMKTPGRLGGPRPAGVDPLARTGRTTAQIKAAPRNARYIVRSAAERRAVVRMCYELDRHDLTVVALEDVIPERCSAVLCWYVVDHAAEERLTGEQRELLAFRNTLMAMAGPLK